MAKKRNNGTNLGLIITLVFFVLTTVILGVTTYMGFADQAEKESAKKKAEDTAALHENNYKWQRMKYRTIASYIQEKLVDDPAEASREKKEFDKNTFAPANKQDAKEKEEFSRVVKVLNERCPWVAEADTAPTKTFADRIKDLNDDIAALKLTVKKAEDAAKASDLAKADLEAMKDKEIAAHKQSLDDTIKKSKEDRQIDLAEIDKKAVIAASEGDKRAGLAKGKDDAQKNALALAEQIRDLQVKMGKLRKEKKDLMTERDDYKNKMSVLLEKSGLDLASVEASALDIPARKILEAWNKPWRIIEMDRRGEMPFINLGSSDGLTPQVTFSIHARGPNGKLSPIPKGTLEVVRVMGAHQAQCRITSTRDAKKDPILKSDVLFNPTWDPSRKRHVVLAGIADMGGDGNDNSDDMRRLLKRQNVILDAYIDTKDDKAPKIIGKLSASTDYVIIGESLDAVRHPKANGKEGKEYSDRFNRLISDLRDKGTANGVTVISLRRYLDMIGYVPPKIVTTGK